MALSNLSDVTNQIQKFWSPLFMKELKQQLLLGALVNKDYQGQIKREGDTVRVSQVNAPAGELKTVGTDADSFTPETISTSYVDIKVDKRAVASYDFDELVDIQSQINSENPELRQSMVYSVAKKINDYLWSIINPSTSAPDHLLTSIANMSASQLIAIRTLAAQAKWDMSKPWYLLADPVYYGDLLGQQTLVSQDYSPADAPVVGGQIANKRFGFNILEDNSRGTSKCLAFHPDFMHLVLASEVRFKISDQHSNNKFRYVMSADILFGAKLGIDAGKKHIFTTANAALNP